MDQPQRRRRPRRLFGGRELEERLAELRRRQQAQVELDLRLLRRP